MRIGLIEAGAPPAALVPAFGTYAGMTQALLGKAHDYATFRVYEGAALPDPAHFDAFVTTGSAAGVYDPDPWIGELETFLRSAAGRTKLVGICFGHQIMAQAFGGRVTKAPQGWGLGLHRYEILEPAAWMDAGPTVAATASHQDQVLAPPPRSRTLGASAFTPHAILAYDEHPSISFQFHPEFEPAFSRALFAGRRAPDLPETQVADAIASLDGANDNARVAGWIDRFLRA